MPAWRQMLEGSLAKNKKLVYAKYAQLATVKQNNRPTARTVVFRGFMDGTDHLTFVTDIRSHKFGELTVNPYAQLCWYFPDSREQYRIDGRVRMIDSSNEDERMQKARKKAWNNMSDGGRVQFAWPHPGHDRVEDESVFSPEPPSRARRRETCKQQHLLQALCYEAAKAVILDTFVLGILEVDQIDYLHLKQNIRKQFVLDGQDWTERALNP